MTKRNSKYKHDFETFFCKTLGYNIMSDPYQYEYVKAILDPETQIIFSDSPSGTGKSSLALSAGYYLLQEGDINKIIYLRSAVPVRDLGFLPGNGLEKEEPYMRPAKDAIAHIGHQIGRQDLVEDMMLNELFECTSTSYLRGVDYSGEMLIVIDEAQNFDLLELQTALTRIHDSVKVVVIGSTLQNDNPKVMKYGPERLLPFEVYMKHFMEQDKIKVRSVNLINNYRGKLSQYADKINSTLKRIEKGDFELPSEDTEFYGPDFNNIEKFLPDDFCPNEFRRMIV